MSHFEPPGDCPNCGEYVEANASSCESCGSCPQTGWNEDSLYDGLDIPFEDEDTQGGESGSSIVKVLGLAVLLVVIVYVFVF